MKRNIHFLVSYKCFKDRTLLYNAGSTHMHTIMMLMRCFGKTVQCNTEGVTDSPSLGGTRIGGLVRSSLTMSSASWASDVHSKPLAFFKSQ